MNDTTPTPMTSDAGRPGPSAPTKSRRSCFFTASTGTIARATSRSRSSRAPSSRSGRGSRWRWWRPPAPANRRCCTSPACSSSPMPARSMSTRSRPRALSDAERTRIRRIDIGFVYQFHHLLMEFSAIENVIMPQMIRGLSRQEATPPRDRPARLSRAQGASDASAGGSSPAASSSGSRSRARSPMRRASCSPTSRPETSIRAPPTTCSPRSRSWCRPPASRWWSPPTTWTSRPHGPPRHAAGRARWWSWR